MSPAFAGRFFTAEPPGKPPRFLLELRVFKQSGGSQLLVRKTSLVTGGKVKEVMRLDFRKTSQKGLACHTGHSFSPDGEAGAGQDALEAHGRVPLPSTDSRNGP